MIRINRVHLRNWRRVRAATVEFPEVGTVAVLGMNGDNGYLKSVGAGKTTLGEAVARAVFGVPRKKSIGKMSFHRKGNTYAKVEGTIDGRPLVVEAGYRCAELGGSGEGLRYSIDGQTIQRAEVKDTRAELNSALGISAELATWTVFLDGDKLQFGDLTQAEQVELLMQSLRQPPWPSYLKTAKARMDKARDSVTRLKGVVESLQASVESSKQEVSRATDLFNRLDVALNAATIEYETKKREHDARVKKAGAEYQAASDAEKKARLNLETVSENADRQAEEEFKDKRLQTEKAYQQAQVEARKAAAKQVTDQAEYRRLRGEYAKFDQRPENCPTCGQRWPADDHLIAERARVQALMQKAKAAAEASAAALEAAENKEQDADAAAYAVTEAMNKRAGAITKEAHAAVTKACEKMDAAADRFEEVTSQEPQIPDAEPLNQAIASLEAEINLRERSIAQLTEKGAELAQAERAYQLQRYWVEALGPTGIPNQIINQALPPLNVAANASGVALTGGVLGVSFSTSCELESGEERNKVTVQVDNPRGADEVSEFSKGEGGLTNLIISESLSMIGQMPRRCAWRWLDEAINNQDRKHVYGYYRNLAHANGVVVFLVDHHPDALALADHVLVATKDAEGFTTYAWET